MSRPKLYRKDFKQIAEIIRHVTMSTGEEAILATSMANELADYLRTTNKQFDRDRFMRACGLIE